MIKAVIFDFDGTIADTLPICIGAFRDVVEPVVGRKMSLEEIRSYFGPTEEGIFSARFPEQKDELLASYYRRYEELQREIPETAPGVMPIIRALRRKNVRVALATAKGAVSCKISLDFYGIEKDFEAIETGGLRGRDKESSIARILEKFNLAPQDAVYVGDSPKDVVSARNAGVEAWSAAWFQSAEPQKILENKPERIFYSIDDFKRALEEEFGAID